VASLIKAMLKAGSYGKGQSFPSERGTPQEVWSLPYAKGNFGVWRLGGEPRFVGGPTDWDAVEWLWCRPHQDIFDTSRTIRWRSVQLSVSGRTAQAGEERRESLRQSQEAARSLALVSDRCSSARSVCSRWRSAGMRSRNCSIDKSASGWH